MQNNNEKHLVTFQDKINETKRSIKRGLKARFIVDGETRHEGIIVDLTTTFAKIYKHRFRKDDMTADVSHDSASWFPIECKGGGIVLS